MSFSKFSFASFFSQYDPRELYRTIKDFLSDLFNQLQIEKVELLKLKHRQTFIRLRREYIDLINSARSFCETSVPLIEPLVEKLEEIHSTDTEEHRCIDISSLMKMAEKLNPGDILKKCEELERGIITFNDGRR
ncbi:unnamed protein product [Didymodactylos carnosus]|nr:unnamed protein product [Didymodactylos carnosus]CAF3769344.1 unnamed protein product [Didymodactylos carnosus]